MAQFAKNVANEDGAGGIHGNFPDPMTAKDQQKKMNPTPTLEDIKMMEFLKSKARTKPYNGSAGAADAHNGLEFEGMGGQVAGAVAGNMIAPGIGGAIGGAIGDKMTDESLEEAVSRKHFQQVADLLKNIPDEAKRKEMAMHHASIFAQQNPRFDMRRFGQACGVDLEECARWEELKGGQKKLDVDGDGDIGADDLAALRAGRKETDEGWRGGGLGEPDVVKTRTSKNANANQEAWDGLMAIATRGVGMDPRTQKYLLQIAKTLKPEGEVDEGFADMDAWLAQREKEKGTGKFDKRKVSTGTVYTRKPETFDAPDADDETPADAPKRGRGRPASTKPAEKRVTKGAWKHKVAEEGEEELDEKAEQGKRKFFDKLAPAAKKVAKVVAKVTGKEDDKAEKAGKKVTKDIEHDEGHKAKGDNKAEKAGKKVTKDIEYDDKKDKKEKKADKKEEKVEETTTSGSVATSGATHKAAASMGIGQGVYESWDREFNRLINESVDVQMARHDVDGAEQEGAVIIRATGEEADIVKELLKNAGLINYDNDLKSQHDHSDGLPGEIEFEVDEGELGTGIGAGLGGAVGGIPGAALGGIAGHYLTKEQETDEDELGTAIGAGLGGAVGGLPGAALGGIAGHYLTKDDDKKHTNEADVTVDENDPDYPSNQEYDNDALQYAGGLNGEKSTGQSTIPVLASQKDRQVSESESFLNLYKAFAKIK
jgi:hypothetical protein